MNPTTIEVLRRARVQASEMVKVLEGAVAERTKELEGQQDALAVARDSLAELTDGLSRAEATAS